jgi:hypothetical protein
MFLLVAGTTWFAALATAEGSAPGALAEDGAQEPFLSRKGA